MRKFLIVSMVVVLSSLIMGAGCFISNLPPILTSEPVTTATVGVLYTYDVEATDPDDDVLTYYLTAYPNGMNINSATGLIKWIPAIEGDYAVVVKVSDGDLDITQSFTIVVSVDEPVIPNKPPEIISSAITSGKVGVKYTYNVNATDPEGDILTYSLTEKPISMSIVPTTGIIKWTPTDAGLFGVGVKVSDPDGLFDTQSFSITVADADEPEPEPELVLVGITVDPKTMDLFVGGSEEIDTVTATYEVRGYEVGIALGNCLLLSSDTDVATVDEDGEVTAVGGGTANIVISYKDKFDTLEVTVTSQGSMEIIADMPEFTVTEDTWVNDPEEFTIETVDNDDVGKEVLFLFELPDIDGINYELEAPEQWGEGTLEPDVEYVFKDILSDEEFIFGVKFTTMLDAGTTKTLETTIEVKTFPEGVLLCSKDIFAVITVIPEPEP